MKKYIYSIALCLLAFAVSCQQQMNEVRQDIQILENSTLGKSVFYTADDEPLTFLLSRDSSAWTSIGSLQGRFDACTVPQQILDNMTTEAIVESVINYPLNYLVLFYNDPMDAVNLIFEKSTLHQELASRTEATSELIGLFSETYVKMGEKTLLTDDSKQLSYTDEMFLEYMISLDCFSKNLDEKTAALLCDAVGTKAQERLAKPETYSISSLEPLMAIDKAASLNMLRYATKGGEIIASITILTPLGKEIEGLIINEITDQEKSTATQIAVANYPNAVVLGPSTALYNCHSYAWHNDSTNNTVWINSTKFFSGDFQLDKYWTLDAFIECEEGNACRVYYPNGDHSAIRLTNGKYVSKWGMGPLMEHDKTYAPYNSSDLRFFKVRTGYVYTLTINGDTTVGLNETNHFYEVSSASNLDLVYEWVVKYMDADEPKPFELIPNGTHESNYSYRLVCKDYGLFKIHVYGNYMGQTIAYGQLNVVAIP